MVLSHSVMRSVQEVLLVAITLLNMFMQANYTGPELTFSFPDFSSVYPFAWFLPADAALKTLEIDGETPYELMKHPLLLSMSRAILEDLYGFLQSHGDHNADVMPFVQWWLARCDSAPSLFM